MAGYTKLFNSILASTIWRANDKTRIVWITLLAMADKDGIAEGSIPGLADMARVSIEDCKSALAELMAPDEYSRTADFEGRRIEPVDGGWLLLNHSKYRAKMSEDDIRERNRQRQAKWRERHKNNADSNVMSQSVTDSNAESRQSRHTEAEADTEADKKHKRRKTKSLTTIPENFEITPSMREWFSSHCPLINIEIETAKFKERCLAKGTEYKDWVAGWRTQMMNAQGWAQERAPVPVTAPNRPTARQMHAKIDAEEALLREQHDSTQR